MIQYDLIQNEKLRILVMNSASLKQLNSDDLAEMVQRVARLPEAGQAELIEVLEEEKKKNPALMSPSEKQKSLEQNLQKMVAIKKHLENEIRHEHEKALNQAENQNVDNLLNNL